MQEPFGLTLSYTYDAAGNHIGTVDSAGGTTTYRVRRRQSSDQPPVRRIRTDAAAHGHDVHGTQPARQRITLQRPGGHTPGGHFDLHLRRCRPARRVAAEGRLGQPAGGLSSTRTIAADNLTSETLNGGTPVTYTYDATNQLVSDSTTSYSYDANGNRTMAGYTTGPANQITSDGTWTYTYDNEGNIIKKSMGPSAETWTYAYDNLNRLVSAQDHATDGGPVTESVNYTYDVLGNRIEEDVTRGHDHHGHPVRLRRLERLGRPRCERTL